MHNLRNVDFALALGPLHHHTEKVDRRIAVLLSRALPHAATNRRTQLHHLPVRYRSAAQTLESVITHRRSCLC